VRAECFALGADDFLEKPVRAEALRDRVAARLELGAGLARELSRDSLTGLPNRAAFYELFKRMRNGVLTLQEPATAAMIVLDSFDRALQDHGQDVADAVVVHAASVLSRAFRSTDFLARFRGCEFTALFPRTGSRGAGTALAKALQALKAEPFVLAEGGTIPLSFSAFLALCFWIDSIMKTTSMLSNESIIAAMWTISFVTSQTRSNRDAPILS
jgi:diguanylate cyclase (GGDEF)-like protein